MATNTYVALDKVTVGIATPSITLTGISSAYTDLVLVMFARDTGSSSATNAAVTVNSNTGNNYSWTNLYGNGSIAGSTRFTNTNNWLVPIVPNSATANVFSSTVCHFMNYSNTTTYKTMLTRADNPTDAAVTRAMLWRSTAAISTITIAATAGNLAVGSTFSLYGIKAQVTPGTAKATGGTITYDQSGNVIHTFTSSGTFTPSVPLSCEYLVVGGGGGAGAGRYGGGGGGGGYRSSVINEFSGGMSAPESLFSAAATGYTVTIGSGGSGGAYDGFVGTNGSDSAFGSIVATGGGKGGGRQTSPYTGYSGGSGGGGSAGGGTTNIGGSPVANQGFAGGTSDSTVGGGGGGGGAGQAGPTTLSGGGSNGGAGLPSTISGSQNYYAGGGGGGSYNTPRSGGIGGGGNSGSVIGGGTPTAGATNTGGGGGSAGDANGQNGGSGVVIIRYSGL